MDKIQPFLYKLFGASWFLSALGYVAMAGGVATLVQDSLKTGGIPTDATGWLMMIVGIGQRVSKQSNVSNAKEPLAVAQPVVAETGAVNAAPAPLVPKP